MKKILTIALTTSVALFTFGCAGTSPSVDSASKLVVKDACSVKQHGVAKVLETADMYNKIAIAEGVEYTRLGMKNRTLIKATKEAAKTGAMVQYTDKKGKPTKEKRSVAYSAHRACNFAISAIQQKVEASKEWRLAVPGDGFKY